MKFNKNAENMTKAFIGGFALGAGVFLIIELIVYIARNWS